MEQTVCKQCRFFIQHYVLTNEGKLAAAYCGHCLKAHLKCRKPDRKSCEEFLPGEEQKAHYVTRQYLRRALLQRVLDMELMPEELL